MATPRTRRGLSRAVCLFLISLLSVFAHGFAIPVKEISEVERALLAHVRLNWSLHPGPLMVDAKDWSSSLCVMDGKWVIREPDLRKIAAVSKRRYVRVGKVDVFAQRLELSPTLQMWLSDALLVFAIQRRDDLFSGLPINQFTANERSLWMDAGSSSPAFMHALLSDSSAPMTLGVRYSWIENGEFRTILSGHLHQTYVDAPAGRPAWAEPQSDPPAGTRSLNFGDGEVVSMSELLGHLYWLGYSYQYDGRLEDSYVLVKGKFGVNDFLGAVKEVLKAAPSTFIKLQADRNELRAECQRILVAALVREGFPVALAERVEFDEAKAAFEISATKKEFREVERLRAKVSNAESEADQVIRMEVLLQFRCDPGYMWRSVGPNGNTSVQGGLMLGLSAP